MTNIELPRDVAGREIPLDTKVLYDGDGNAKEVQAFDYSPVESMWRVLLLGDFILFLTSDMHLTPPDSWEKLFEDLDNAAEKASSSIYIATPCAWFSDGNRHCADCPADEPPEDTCGVKLIKDIAARIRKLRGEER